VREAEQHLQTLVSHGVLELGSDDEGHMRYVMPDRPVTPMTIDHPALSGPRVLGARGGPSLSPPGAGGPAQAIVVRGLRAPSWDSRRPSQGQAVASMFLNAMVCPGVGSLVGGKTGTGLAQLSLFLVGLPLAVITIGLPLMLAAWVWGVATGAQLIAEARE
jgi:TM2 domain-containing membrane protein YozV